MNSSHGQGLTFNTVELMVLYCYLCLETFLSPGAVNVVFIEFYGLYAQFSFASGRLKTKLAIICTFVDQLPK